mmetsp:Transcript_34251/g.55101  ORF Transcript_34251/g.55101 Transcript_34251/m.55101 type:complete len:231 (-) Transcript_34251:441-1133(-)
MDGLLREVIPERASTDLPDGKVHLHHGGTLQAVSLQLQSAMERSLLDHGRIQALSLAAACVLHGVAPVREDHEAEVGQPQSREGRRDKRPAHARLQLAVEVLYAPLNSSAGRPPDIRSADGHAKRQGVICCGQCWGSGLLQQNRCRCRCRHFLQALLSGGSSARNSEPRRWLQPETSCSLIQHGHGLLIWRPRRRPRKRCELGWQVKWHVRKWCALHHRLRQRHPERRCP